MGKLFPFVSRSGSNVMDDFSAAIGSALRQELGHSHHAIKTVMRWTNASERTVKNWLACRNGPNGLHLVQVLRHSDQAFGALMELSNRDAVFAASEIMTLRSQMLAIVELIDLMFQQPPSHRS
ncbi:MAG: hypothetical protein JSR99_18990 [Proteobacteria bacterium]|nr:hypothetical protein [Pseudomonadota bacterium]